MTIWQQFPINLGDIFSKGDILFAATVSNPNDINNYLYGLVLDDTSLSVHKFCNYLENIQTGEKGLYLFSITGDISQGNKYITDSMAIDANTGMLTVYTKDSNGNPGPATPIVFYDNKGIPVSASAGLACVFMQDPGLQPQEQPQNYLTAYTLDNQGNPTVRLGKVPKGNTAPSYNKNRR